MFLPALMFRSALECSATTNVKAYFHESAGVARQFVLRIASAIKKNGMVHNFLAVNSF